MFFYRKIENGVIRKTVIKNREMKKINVRLFFEATKTIKEPTMAIKLAMPIWKDI